MGLINLLNCDNTRESVTQALKSVNSEDFETKATEAGMCVSALRSFQQWDVHPQAIALRGKAPIRLIKIGEAPPRIASRTLMPLENVKVLEMTRIIAGPVAGRTLASTSSSG